MTSALSIRAQKARDPNSFAVRFQGAVINEKNRLKKVQIIEEIII